MPGEAALFLFAIFMSAVLLFAMVFFIIMFSDLECDFINPIDLCNKLNRLVLPEYMAHAFVWLLFLLNMSWSAWLMNTPLVAYHVYKISQNRHMYDATEIFRTLPQHKKECFVKRDEGDGMYGGGFEMTPPLYGQAPPSGGPGGAMGLAGHPQQQLYYGAHVGGQMEAYAQQHHSHALPHPQHQQLQMHHQQHQHQQLHSLQQQQHVSMHLNGPSASAQEYHGTIGHATPAQTAIKHQQMVVQRIPLASQSSAPHFHARYAAETTRQLLKQAYAAPVDDDMGPLELPRASTSAPNNASNARAVDKQHPFYPHVMMAQDKENARSQWLALDLGGVSLRAVSEKSLLFYNYRFLTVLYLNHNRLAELPPAIGLLNALKVLDVSNNQLRLLPSEIGSLRSLEELWAFDNYLETVPWELAWCRNLNFLGIENNPVMKMAPPSLSSEGWKYEHPIAEVLYREGLQAMLGWLRDQMPVEVMVPAMVPRRKWIRSAQDPGNDSTSTTSIRVSDLVEITVMSYNILCERYATQSQYWYTPAWALRWQYRRERLLSEILETDADIICLQEVDWSQYEEFWYPKLCGKPYPKKSGTGSRAELHPSSTGTSEAELSPECHSETADSLPPHLVYESYFYPKSRFRTMTERMKHAPGGGVDGCATFWKRSKFRMTGQPMIVEFSQLALGRSDFEKNDTMFERFCSKDNIAIGVVLESLQASADSDHHRLLVTNAHLHWDPAQTDVKLVQTVMLMEEVEKYCKKFLKDDGRKGGHKKLPLLMCGDFNSLPNSLVCQFLKNERGIRDFDQHPDLTECFNLDSPPTEDATVPVSESDEKAAKPERTSHSDKKNESADDNSSVPIRRWANWKQSGYGSIAKADSLVHSWSGSLKSAYESIENVKVENENIYIPPVQVISAASEKGHTPTYPVPALPFTNHTARFTGVIDYIWYSTHDFDVSGLLGGYFFDGKLGKDILRWIREGQVSEPPHLQELHVASSSSGTTFTDTLLMTPYSPISPTSMQNMALFPSGGGVKSQRVWSIEETRTVGFPNPVFPSDHIPVVCELKFRLKKASKK